jgi:hypothetical protein
MERVPQGSSSVSLAEIELGKGFCGDSNGHLFNTPSLEKLRKFLENVKRTGYWTSSEGGRLTKRWVCI